MEKVVRDLSEEVTCSTEETSIAAVRIDSGRIMEIAGQAQKPD